MNKSVQVSVSDRDTVLGLLRRAYKVASKTSKKNEGRLAYQPHERVVWIEGVSIPDGARVVFYGSATNASIMLEQEPYSRIQVSVRIEGRMISIKKRPLRTAP